MRSAERARGLPFANSSGRWSLTDRKTGLVRCDLVGIRHFPLIRQQLVRRMIQDTCPKCSHPITMTDAAYGTEMECPHCRRRFILTAPIAVKVPQSTKGLTPIKSDGPHPLLLSKPLDGVSAGGQRVVCVQCGLVNPENNNKCVDCGTLLHLSRIGFEESEFDYLGRIVPLRNPDALLGYYLGAISFIPILGLVVVYFAFRKGLSGIRKAKGNPSVPGLIHGWIAIVQGCLSIIFHLCIIVFALVVLVK